MSKEALSGTILYLNAGGRGTRLDGIVPGDPETGVAKASLMVGDPPLRLIDHHQHRAFFQGISRILIGLGDQDARYDYRRCQSFGYYPPSQGRYGTGGDLLQMLRLHRDDIDVDDTILVHNVDTILHISDSELVAHHKQLGAAMTIAQTTGEGVPNQGAFLMDADDMVLHSLEAKKNPHSRAEAERMKTWQGSSVGAVVLNAAFLDELDWQPKDGECSLYSDILAIALGQGSLGAYNNGERFFMDVGTPETLRLAQQPRSPVQPYLQYGDYDRSPVAA